MTDELVVVDGLGVDDDHAAAERSLTAHGWTRCGVGDWAVVLTPPSGTLAARISPFDPVAPYTVELFRRASATRQVPVLHRYLELEGGAVCTVMERLEAADQASAKAFFAAIDAREPSTRDLADAVDAVLVLARQELPWCGPLDSNPSNVMRRADGGLVLTDPFFADGPTLFGSLLTDPMEVARLIPASRRRHMFELPLGESGPWDPVERSRMRDALAEADRRLSTPDSC